MLIRSQDKDELLNFDCVSGLNVYEAGDRFGIAAESFNYSETIGDYSSEKKAIKVLDMIQEAYANSKVTELLIPEIGKMVKEAAATEENKIFAEAIGVSLAKKLFFQMPEDSEVE